MMGFWSFSIKTAFYLTALSRACAANLYLADDQRFSLFDTGTGIKTRVATGTLGTVVNNSFEVHDGTAFQGGQAGGRSAVSVTNLATGASRNFTLSKTDLPQFGGFWNGNLILADDSDYYSFDPLTGKETFLAKGLLSTVVNSSFEVHDGVAYHGGLIGGQNAISAVNLLTGVSRSFQVPGLRYIQFGGFWNDSLILADDTKYYAFDTSTGKTTRLATGALGTV
ncbi:MAG: hypothetical protein EOP85_19900, partial [Verrucomicrobiaceae bacterium]